MSETETALTNELLGYFRRAGQTVEQGNAESVEKLILCGIIYGATNSVDTVITSINLPPRYHTIISRLLKGR